MTNPVQPTVVTNGKDKEKTIENKTSSQVRVETIYLFD